MKLKFAIVVFPGSNCDHDAYHVLQDILNVPVDFVWHKENNLAAFDCIIMPLPSVNLPSLQKRAALPLGRAALFVSVDAR